MSEATVETDSITVKHHGYKVRVHIHDLHPAWTFRIDNPTIYRDQIPSFGFDPRFTNRDDAVDAAIRYLSFLHEFTQSVEAAQIKFTQQLNEFPVVNNLEREKRSYEAVNG